MRDDPRRGAPLLVLADSSSKISCGAQLMRLRSVWDLPPKRARSEMKWPADVKCPGPIKATTRSPKTPGGLPASRSLRNGGKAVGCGEPLHDGEVRPAPFAHSHLHKPVPAIWAGSMSWVVRLATAIAMAVAVHGRWQSHLYHRAGSHPTGYSKRPLRCRR